MSQGRTFLRAKWLLILLAVPAVIFAGVLLTAAHWMVWGIESSLPGLEARIASARINPIDGRVELEGLSLRRDGNEVLNFYALVVDLSLRSLLNKQLILDHLQIKHGELWVEEGSSGSWRVAGVAIPQEAAEPADTDKNADTPASGTGDPVDSAAKSTDPIAALGVGFKNIILEQFTLNHLKVGEELKTARINKLLLTGPGLLNSASQLEFLFNSNINKTNFALSGKSTPFAVPVLFAGKLQLTDFPLALSKEFVQGIPDSLDGLFSSNLDLKVSYGPKITSDIKVKGDLKLVDFSFAQEQLTVKLPLTAWSGEVVAALPPTAKPTATIKGKLDSRGGDFKVAGATPLQAAMQSFAWQGVVNTQGGEGNVQLFGVEAATEVGGVSAIEVQKFMLNGLKFDVAQTVTVDGLELAKLIISTKDKQAPPLLTIAGVDLQKLQYSSAGRLVLGSLAVHGSGVHLHRDSNNNWPWSTKEVGAGKTESSGKTDGAEKVEVQVAATEPTATPDKNAVVPAPADGQAKAVEPFSYAFGAVTFPEGIEFSLHDEGVTPEVNVAGFVEQLELGAIDSQAPQKQTPFKIKGKFGEYGKFEFAGHSKPLIAQPDLVVEGFVKSLSLPPFSPYVVPEMGHMFASGTLDIETNTNIGKNSINAKNGLLLKMFKLDSANNTKSDEVAKKLPVPMNAALDLLRDGNGDIKLALPVTGSVDNPNVDFSGIISKAVGKISVKAAKTTAIAALGPIGLALAAVEMVGTAAVEAEKKSHLQPLMFAPGSAQLDVAGKELLDKMVGYLGKKEKQRVTACGVVVAADQELLQTAVDNSADPMVKPADSNFEDPMATSSRPLRRNGGKPYYSVRVASFSNLKLAEKAEEKWRKRGYEPHIRELSGSNDKKWYAISIGRFDTKQDANKRAATIKKKHNVKLFINKIKNSGMSRQVAVESTRQVGRGQGKISIDRQLLSLANARSSVVKGYLVNSGKIADDRVFACTPIPPQADDKLGPRVQFSF